MTEIEAFVANFAQAQLAQVMRNGADIGLSPLTTLTTVLQAAAGTLVQIARAEATALLRAYADCIEAGPGESPAKTAAVARFSEAASALVAVAAAARDFPSPQGRA
jgi:hypothetical protein